MLKSTSHILAALIVLVCGFAGLQAQSDGAAQQSSSSQTADRPTHPRPFVDRDGDGFNDLAPDDDGDGIPNGMDPDFRPGRGYRNRNWMLDAPDSALSDSTTFRKWWMDNQKNREWKNAWEDWQRWCNDNGVRPGIRNHDGFSPLRNRFFNDPKNMNPRHRRLMMRMNERRNRGGDPPHGGGGRRRGGGRG